MKIIPRVSFKKYIYTEGYKIDLLARGVKR